MGKDSKGKELRKGIRQNKNGRYEARYIVRFGKRKSIYGTSKVEVRNKLQMVLKENAENETVKRRMTVRHWYKEWMNIYKIPVIRPNTRRHYKHIFDAFILPEIGEMYVDEVRQIHVKNLINLLDAKGCKVLLYQKLNGDDGKEFHVGPPKTESIRFVILLQRDVLRQAYFRRPFKNIWDILRCR